MTAVELQNRYVILADEIARLVQVSNALEISMSSGRFVPMSLQVGDYLRAAHAAIINPCLTTLSEETGVPVEVV